MKVSDTLQVRLPVFHKENPQAVGNPAMRLRVCFSDFTTARRGAAAVCVCLALCLTMALPVSASPSFDARHESYKERGDFLYRTHDQAPDRFGQAISLYEKALEIKPDDYDTLWRLAMMCQIYGQSLPENDRNSRLSVWKKGRRYGERAMKANPEGKEGHFWYMSNLGSFVQIKGKIASLLNLGKIKKEMNRTLEIDPDYPPALVARAQLLTQVPGIFGRDEEEAMRLYRHAVEVDPTYYIAYYYMAELHVKNGRLDEAVKNLEKILYCPEANRNGNWVTLERPLAERLLRKTHEMRQ